MGEFTSPVDIGNRALQHVGVGAKNRITSFTDDSKNAAAVNFVYDKVRRAELRRNNWRFSIKRAALRPIDTTTLFLMPALWSATVAYPVGAIVKDSSGILWVNTTPFNLNHTPGTDTLWDVYFGPLTITPYDATIGYYLGELLYKDNGAGKIEVFAALTEGTSNDPGTQTVWAATTTYAKGQVVVDSNGFDWISLIDLNLNNTPGAYNMWQSTCTYAKGDKVGATDGKVYISLANSNTGNKPQTDSLLYNPNTTNFGGAHWMPTGDLLPWTANFLSSAASSDWIGQVGAGVAAMNIIYPLGAGPSSDTASRNVYRLPNGYLREAPQDPKRGAVSILGGPSGNMYRDWNLESDYIVTAQSSVIVFRFIGNVTLVSRMDDMFCEGLACRIADAICEELTQSRDKIVTIQGEYTKFMGEARTINAIEVGTEQPDEDEFIACRL